MPTYTKLFNSIVTSTIWTEDDKTRIVWITMLALADKNGEVHASIPGLARVAGVALDDCQKAIQTLASPDPYSRTPDNEGRRICPIDGGWELMNHAKYRLMASKEDSKAASAARVKRHRERNANVTQCNGHVTPKRYSNGLLTQDRDIAEADTDTDTEEIPPNPLKGELPKAGKDSDNTPTSPQAIRIAELFRRRPTTPWSAKEIRSYKAIGVIDPEDLELVCRYTEAERAKGDQGIHRRDLATFLNNFHGELDRARQRQMVTAPTPQKQITFID
jgi:hypothetical protein